MTPTAARVWRIVGIAAAVVFLLVWVWYAPFSVLGTANLALIHAMVGLSLVVLTGWVGQISLAQASFVGIGAFVTGGIVRAFEVPFPITLPIGALVAAGSAALLGVVALRVRGLYLAVATLIFAWMAQEYLFNQPWLAGVGGASSAPQEPLGIEGTFPYLNFADRKTFYYVMLAATAAAILAVANLRDSKTGRAWFAVKGSEIAAASLGIAVTRYKLLAFAVSGFLAGAAGNLRMTHYEVANSSNFSPDASLFYLAVVVVGGLVSLPGVVAAAALFASLQEVFFRIELTGVIEIVSALLLAVVLLFFPAGLAGVPARWSGPVRRLARSMLDRGRGVRTGPIRHGAGGDELEAEGDAGPDETFGAPRRARFAALTSRLPKPPKRRARDYATPDALAPTLAVVELDEHGAVIEPSAEAEPQHVQPIVEMRQRPAIAYVAGTATKVDLPPRELRTPILVARDITVRFGGLTAVDNAQLEVREGEIVGLIGPNGAGKTTLFNAISGLNEPTEGTVELFGHDITSLPVHERAAMGMGRTFQLIQLFPQLTVFDNLLVATHLRNPTGFFGHLVATETAVDEEVTARRRVRQVVALLGLDEVADRPVKGLPFGVLRMVEVARALVTGAPFVMLDEPASGLDNAETDRLSDLLLWVRQSLGVSLLVIEHDVKMVTSLTDYMYVIERGKPIADGTPADIQRNEAVIAAYLGKPAGSEEREPVVV